MPFFGRLKPSPPAHCSQACVEPRDLGAGLIVVVGGWLLLSAPRAVEPVPLGPVRVDLNTAPRAVLLALPRLGPQRVDAILAERAIEPFEALEDLDRRVKGLGPATIRALAPYLDVPTR